MEVAAGNRATAAMVATDPDRSIHSRTHMGKIKIGTRAITCNRVSSQLSISPLLLLEDVALATEAKICSDATQRSWNRCKITH